MWFQSFMYEQTSYVLLLLSAVNFIFTMYGKEWKPMAAWKAHRKKIKTLKKSRFMLDI